MGSQFINHVISVGRDKLLECMEQKGVNTGYSLSIHFLKLFEADPILGENVLCNPKNAIPKCDQDLIKAQEIILDELSDEKKLILSIKNNIKARFYGLPVCPELHRTTVPKNDDLGCFIKFTGTVIRMTQSKLLEFRRPYKCSKCQHIQLVNGKYEQRYIIKPPQRCKNPNIQCRSTTFSAINQVTRENCKDYQEMKIQEQVNKLTVGGIPGSIWITLEDDLVDCCKPGDDVSVCGTVSRRWNPISVNKKCEVDLTIDANHVEISNAQKAVAISMAPDVKKEFNDFWSEHVSCPMKARDIILASICPKIYGLYMIKLALLLTVITGCSQKTETENIIFNKSILNDDNREKSVRGQCHLLLVGDPGTGKSQLLKAGAMLTNRSILTSGSGSTKAGLTCTALREDGEWQLEAGALVLADGGTCCIDEMAQMREHDRASIHEAMEQQTISVAKAGIICKLNTRCSVIAACNPKGQYDTEQALSVNVSLGTPLLSRFDLIFILLDKQDDDWDKLVSDYILFGKTSVTPSIENWSMDKIQTYISLIGPKNVKMTSSAVTILQEYYVRQRKSEYRDPSRTTVRMLDSLVRLSQAHARLMYRGTVMIMDAVNSVLLMDLSMQDCSISGSGNALHSNFSKCPDIEYLKMAKELLHTLELPNIWNEELSFYSSLLKVNRDTLDNEISSGSCKYFKIHNTDEISSQKPEKSEPVVESNYFVKSRTVSENDDNLDEILDIDSFMNSDKSLNDSNLENNIKLKNSLQKFSNMRAKNSVNILGPITGKRKRVYNRKPKKSIDDNVSKKIKTTNKKKTNQVNHTEKSDESDFDAFVDQSKDLKGVPSVNDIFTEIGINYESFSDDESEKNSNKISESYNENTEKEYDNVDKVTAVVEVHNENNKNNVNSLKSPVSDKTVSKLKGFSFKSTKIINNEGCDKSICISDKPSKKSDKLNLKAKTNSSSSHSSQISIFEDEDDNYDVLNDL